LSSKARGSFYLVWKKGKKSTQSAKYQFTADDALSPKELLALSLKVYQVANAPLPRHVPPFARRPTSSSSPQRGNSSTAPNS
jgi:hypothetical protein